MKSFITLSLLVFIFLSNRVYSQPFDDVKTKDTTSYETIEGEIAKIGKYNMTLELDSLRLNNTDYLDSVYNLIYCLNARIDYISLPEEDEFKQARGFFDSKSIEIRIIPENYTNVGCMDIRIADTSNIFDIKEFLENTGFFFSISYFPVFEESTYPLEPNDYYWSEQLGNNFNKKYIYNLISHNLNLNIDINKKIYEVYKKPRSQF